MPQAVFDAATAMSAGGLDAPSAEGGAAYA